MKIFLNGAATEYPDGTTVAELIKRHDLSPEVTLVERNGIAMHWREWAERTLRENDRLEILRVAAGG